MTACDGCHLVPRGKPICTLAYYVLLASRFYTDTDIRWKDAESCHQPLPLTSALRHRR